MCLKKTARVLATRKRRWQALAEQGCIRKSRSKNSCSFMPSLQYRKVSPGPSLPFKPIFVPA